MKINISKKDIIWNYIGVIVSLGGNFLLIPFLLKFLSRDYYGLWNVFTSLGAISALFDFGFNSLFARNVAYSWSGANHLEKENVVSVDENKSVNFVLLKKVIKTCKIIYLIISTIAFFVLLTFGSWYVLHVGKVINNNIEVLVAWGLYAIGICLDLLYGYYDSFLRGIGKVAEDNFARVVSKGIQIVLTILLLFFNVGIISISICNILYGFIFRGICKDKFYSPYVKEGLKRIGKVSNKDILNVFVVVWHNTWREGVVSVANYLSNQTTTLLCSLYLGLSVTASFGLAVQFTSAIAQISAALFSSYMPSIQEAYAHRNYRRLRSDVSFGIGSYMVLYPIGLVCLLILMPIINLIISGKILNIELILGVGIYQFIIKYRDCYAWYLGGTNRVIYYKSFLVASLLCILFSVLLVQYFKWGVRGFIIAQILSQLLHNAWYWPRLVDKELNLTFKKKMLQFKEHVREIM